MKQYRYSFIIVLVVVLVIFFSLSRGAWFSGVDKDTYQAVFLTTDQMYFGKLSSPSGRYLKLSDVYYIKSNSPEEQANSQFSLIKRGDEIHQPQDVMFISHDQVLLWENLKQDANVIQLIGQQKLQAANPAPTAPAAPAAPVAPAAPATK